MTEETSAGGVGPTSVYQRASFHVDITRDVVDNLVDQFLREGDTE